MPIDQTTHFANDLEALITRYRHEYEITYAQMLGVLQIQMFLLCRRQRRGRTSRMTTMESSQSCPVTPTTSLTSRSDA